LSGPLDLGQYALDQLFHGYSDDAADDSSHAQRRNVQSGGYFDANGKYGHNYFEYQSQTQQGQSSVHARSSCRTFNDPVNIGVITVIITEKLRSFLTLI
jgi:hypothetical protein